MITATLFGAGAMTAPAGALMTEQTPPTAPGIERLDPALDRLLAPDTRIETLAEGYEWAEGPIWVKNGGYLLFSDVLKNTVHRWKAGEGAKPYLTPSGYTSSAPRGGETGSNGLTLDHEGRLVLCQHGDRRVARMDAPLTSPKPAFVTLADKYDGTRFNSPNDLVFKSNGDLYFTDPAYGMEKQWDDPKREMNYAGVFRRSADGKVTLLTKDMTRPNGLAFSPDEKLLYVAQSDEKAAIWRVFDVKADGTIDNSRVLLDVTAMTKTKTGLPDGLKIDGDGNLWADRARRRARHLPARQAPRHDPHRPGDRQRRLRRRRPLALHHRRHVPDARQDEDERRWILNGWWKMVDVGQPGATEAPG